MSSALEEKHQQWGVDAWGMRGYAWDVVRFLFQLRVMCVWIGCEKFVHTVYHISFFCDVYIVVLVGIREDLLGLDFTERLKKCMTSSW